MGAAARRPLVVGLVVGLLALAGGLLALRLTPTAGDRHARRQEHAQLRRHPAPAPEASATTRSTCSSASRSRSTVLTSDLDRVLGLEGCISGNVPEGPDAARGRDGARAARLAARPSRCRSSSGPGTFLNEAVGQIQDQFNGQKAASAQQAQQADQAARKLALAHGKSPAEARKLGKQAQQLVYAEFLKTIYSLALKYGFTSVPQLNDPQFVSQIVFDDTKAAGRAQGALRLPLPEQDVVADPGAPEAGPVRARARADDRRHPRRRARCPTGAWPTARATTS